jgi:hypothetical protein
MISMEEQLVLSRFVLDVQHLLHLDQIWTQRLADGAPLSAAEIEQISWIVEQMDGLLEKLPVHCDALEQSHARNSANFAPSRARASANTPFEQYLRAIEPLLPMDGIENTTGGLRKRLNSIRTNVPVERRELSIKLAGIREARKSDGDLSSRFMCDIGKGLIVGGLLGFETGVGAAAFATGAIISVTYRCLVP